jgi:ankyrin repeat protein
MRTLLDSNITFKKAHELIENGADVNEPDAFGQTPLYYTNYSKVAQLYIENGANVNHVDNNGHTPLFKVNNKAMAELFIQHGADVNHKDKYGLNALYYINKSHIVDLLIKHNTNFNIFDKDFYFPVDYQSDLRCARVYIKHGALPGKINTFLQCRDLFTKEQQKAFDAFVMLTSDNDEFYQMCLAYQEGIKNGVKIEIKEMDIA